jgi:hypothetical protein
LHPKFYSPIFSWNVESFSNYAKKLKLIGIAPTTLNVQVRSIADLIHLSSQVRGLHRFFPLLWITVLKFGTLHAKIEIREVGLTMAIHSNSVTKVHPVGTEASVSKPARLQSQTHFCPTCKECGLGKTMCTIPCLCDCKGGPTFEHLQSFLIY